MFAGHLGAALMLKGITRKVALSALLFAALLLDVLLWVLVLFGVETIQIPPAYRRGADIGFTFPFSHGLLASLLWSTVTFGVSWILWKKPGKLVPAAVLATGVFSHFVLDWLVHKPELPLVGPGSTAIGLGLWRYLPWAWTVEALLLAVGLWVYLRTVALPRGRRVVLIATLSFTMLLTVTGQASTAPPPKPSIMAATSLVAMALLMLMAWWVERTRTDLDSASQVS